MGTVDYIVGDEGNDFPTSGFGKLFPDFMTRANQKGGVYFSNDIGDRWYLDSDFTVSANFPDGQADENYTVYCKFTTANIGIGNIENSAENVSYANIANAKLALQSFYISGRDDAYEASKAVFEKKDKDQWGRT